MAPDPAVGDPLGADRRCPHCVRLLDGARAALALHDDAAQALYAAMLALHAAESAIERDATGARATLVEIGELIAVRLRQTRARSVEVARLLAADAGPTEPE